MPATFGFASADVTVDTGIPDSEPKLLEAHNILVRGGRGVLRTRAGILVDDRRGVAMSERLGHNSWKVTFADGVVWTVTVSKRCATCG